MEDQEHPMATRLRSTDEFDVTCCICGGQILSWDGSEARKWITQHKKKHSKNGRR